MNSAGRDEIPDWALREDGSLGDTNVPKLGMEQEHFARLACERYEKILELERKNLELSGELTCVRDALTRENRELREALDSLANNHRFVEHDQACWYCTECDEEALIGQEVIHDKSCSIGKARAALAKKGES